MKTLLRHMLMSSGGPEAFILEYLASGEGYISGKVKQRVIGGKDASEVTAVPNSEAYEFLPWDDGVLTPARQDLAVIADAVYTALFGVVGPPVVTQIYNA